MFEQRNKFEKGDVLEVLTPSGKNFAFTVDKMYDEWDNIIESAPHAQQTVKIDLGRDIPEYSIVRMINKNYKPE